MWEYKIENYRHVCLEPILTFEGLNGWELAAVVNETLIFKRPLYNADE